VKLSSVATLDPATETNEEKTHSIIIRFGVVKNAGDDAFNGLCSMLKENNITTKGEWETLLRPGEDLTMATYFDSKKDTKKDGSWKYSRIRDIAPGYPSAKSVISTALEKGTPIFKSDGAPYGKTHIEKMNKGLVDTEGNKVVQSPKSTEQKLTEAWEKVKQYFPDANDESRRRFRSEFKEWLG